MRNTFLNAKTNPNAMIVSSQPATRGAKVELRWADETAQPLAQEVAEAKDLVNIAHPKRVNLHRTAVTGKSAMKLAKDPNNIVAEYPSKVYPEEPKTKVRPPSKLNFNQLKPKKVNSMD